MWIHPLLFIGLCVLIVAQCVVVIMLLGLVKRWETMYNHAVWVIQDLAMKQAKPAEVLQGRVDELVAEATHDLPGDIL